MLQNTIILCLELPKDRFDLDESIFLFDSGLNWDKNSVFGLNHLLLTEINFLKKFNAKGLDSLIFNFSYSFEITDKKATKISSYLVLKHKNFYSYLNPNIVNDNTAFNGYTGIPREKSRLGFNSGETNASGFGYKNQNILFQIGRGRENWSAGNEIGLALSKNSPSYDYFKFIYEKNKIRFIYFHGFLENIDAHNRYISGKGFEFTNKKSLILGFSEIIIYSGLNRPIDFAYFNPTSSHLEIELNDRQNLLGPDDANAVWQLSFDFLIRPNIRLSSNLIVDELTMDKIELDSGKVSGLGFSSRLSIFKKFNDQLLTFYGKYISVGTHTFRHAHGYNNFVQRGLPLGWKYGSDGYKIAIGINYYNADNLIINSSLGKLLVGSSRITINQYEPFYNDYKSGPFPSGNSKNNYIFNIKLNYRYDKKNNIYISYETFNNIDSLIRNIFNIGFQKYLF